MQEQSFEDSVFLAFGKSLDDVKRVFSFSEIKRGVASYFRKEQMLHLQNYESLCIIVGKIFGSDSKKSTGKTVEDAEELEAIFNDIG